MTPRVLFVGRGRLTLPLAPWLQRKWDALSEVLDLRVLNAGTGNGDARFTAASRQRGGVLSAAAVRGRALAARVSGRGDRRLRPVHRRGRAPGADARALAGAARRRGARRSAHVHARLRLAGSPARLDAGRRRRALGHPARRRDARALGVHVVARRRGDRAPGDGVLPDVQRPRAPFAIRRSCPSPTPSASCSSARSRPTRTSTGSPPPGGASPRGIPDAMLVDRRTGLAARGDRPAGRGPAGPGRAPRRAVARRGRGADRRRAGARASVVPGGARPRRARGVRARPDGRRHGRRRHPGHGDRRRRCDPDPARRHAMRSSRRCVRVLEDKELAVRLGAAARATYAQWDQTVTDFADAYRALVDVVIEATLKLVFVTQELDPSHPGARADGRPRRRARASVSTSSRSSRATVEWDGVPANATVRTFDAARKARSRLAVRAVAERVARRCGRGARAHGPAVRTARGAARCASAACRSRSGTRTGTPAARCAPRRPSSTSSSASTARASRSPSPKVRGIGHAIDVERFAPGPLVDARRAAAAARARPHGPLEGPRDAARCVSRWRSAAAPTFASRSEARRSPTTSARIGSSSSGASRATTRCARASRSCRRSRVRRSRRSSPPPTSSSVPTSRARVRPSTRRSSRPRRADVPSCRRILRSRSLLGGLSLPLLAPARDPEALAEAIVALAGAGAAARGAGRRTAAGARRGRPLPRPLGRHRDRRSEGDTIAAWEGRF